MVDISIFATWEELGQQEEEAIMSTGIDPHDPAIVAPAVNALRELWNRPNGYGNPTRTVPGDHIIVYTVLEAVVAALTTRAVPDPRRIDTGYELPSGERILEGDVLECECEGLQLVKWEPLMSTWIVWSMGEFDYCDDDGNEQTFPFDQIAELKEYISWHGKMYTFNRIGNVYDNPDLIGRLDQPTRAVPIVADDAVERAASAIAKVMDEHHVPEIPMPVHDMATAAIAALAAAGITPGDAREGGDGERW